MQTAITGPEKIKKIKHFVCKTNLNSKVLKILDIGGGGILIVAKKEDK